MQTGIIKTLAIVLATSLALVAAPASWGHIVSSVSPQGRSVQVGEKATAFALVINHHRQKIAVGCTVTLNNPNVTLKARPIGKGVGPGPVDIPPKGRQRFFLSFEAISQVEEDVVPIFSCEGGVQAPVFTGLNTLHLTASYDPVADVFATIATKLRDGVVRLDSRKFAYVSAAAINIGAPGDLTVSVEATGKASSLVTGTLCPIASGCNHTSKFLPEVIIDEGDNPNVALLIRATGDVARRPATERLVLRYEDSQGRLVGLASAAIAVDLSRRNRPPVIHSFSVEEDEYQPYKVHFKAEVTDPDGDALGLGCYLEYGEGYQPRKQQRVSRGVIKGCEGFRTFQYDPSLRPGTLASDSDPRALVAVKRRDPYTANPRLILTDGTDIVSLGAVLTMRGTGMFPGQDDLVEALDTSGGWHPNYFLAVAGAGLENHRSGVLERATSMGVPPEKTFWNRYGEGAVDVFGIGMGYSFKGIPVRMHQRRLEAFGVTDFLADRSLKVVSIPVFGVAPILLEEEVRAVEALDVVWVHSVGNRGVIPGSEDGGVWRPGQLDPRRENILQRNLERLRGRVVFAGAVEIGENGTPSAVGLDCGILMDWCFVVPAGTTSTASGIVSGMIFIFRQFYSSPEDAVEAMASCTRDIGAPGTDLVFGLGILDLYACPPGVRNNLGIEVPTRTP